MFSFLLRGQKRKHLQRDSSQDILGTIFDKFVKSQISHPGGIRNQRRFHRAGTVRRAQRQYIDIIHFALAFLAPLFTP